MIDPRQPLKESRKESATRVRASHSRSAVLEGAIAILDEFGAPGLTIRALAARMGGGPASIYWYVSGRDELLDLAADEVLRGVYESSVNIHSEDPVADLREIALSLYDAIADRPWLGDFAMRNTVHQTHSLQLYEFIGQHVMRLKLGALESFYAASAIVGFVIGIAADLGQEVPEEVASGLVTREELLAGAANQWRTLDRAQFPFVHHIVDVFAEHDDRDQFCWGLDLLLDGLALRAQRAAQRATTT